MLNPIALMMSRENRAAISRIRNNDLADMVWRAMFDVFDEHYNRSRKA